MNRRKFLTIAGAASLMSAKPPATRIIDTHTHFYDPTRPGGVPWPSPDEKILYRPVLPPEYVLMTRALGITGTIEVEASPLVEDNQWVLDLAARHPILVGTVGDLEPGKPNFARHLERFHRNPLFRGIRAGTIWNRYIATDVQDPAYIPDLARLAEAGLELDVVGDGDLSILPAILKITDRIPTLRVVIDHLPFDPPKEAQARAAYEQTMREVAARPLVYAKISNVPRNVNGRVPQDAAHYRPALDPLWELFGPDRVLYGSNWPVSDRIAPFPVAFRIVSEYFTAKGTDAAGKYFWKNSQAAYRWTAPGIMNAA